MRSHSLFLSLDLDLDDPLEELELDLELPEELDPLELLELLDLLLPPPRSLPRSLEEPRRPDPRLSPDLDLLLR